MAYKCVFSDIDGTLLNSKHQISEKTKKKVQQLAIQNIPFVLVSARMPKGMHYFLDELQNNQQVMAPLELSEIYGICDDGEKRYKKENPPGYKDAKEKDGIRKYSDLIWWKEVIQYARKSRKNIVLVTDDVKEDWWKIDKKFVKYGSEVNWLRKLLSKLGKYAAGVWIYYTIVYSMYIIQILSSLGGTIKSWVLLYLIGVAISFAGAWLHQKIARSNVNIEERYEKGN